MNNIPISDKIPELDIAIKAAQEASSTILEIYHSDYSTFTKNDDSPVTDADLKSNKIINKILSDTKYSILSEEDEDNQDRLSKDMIWIVDPLDGTSDFIDKTGELVNGDSLLAIFAQDMKHRNVLNGDTTAVTVMTNFGFHLAMKESEIRTHTTPVGDRHILQALHKNNWSLGGEQSGHIIFPDFSPTGDGILTALQLLDIVKRTKKSVKELSDSAMQKYPQSLRAVQITKLGLGVPEEMEQAIKKVEKSLGEDGRVLVRASGTEPILRIMVEAREQLQVDLYAQELEETAKKIFSKNF